jgi:hypothetical protein
MSISRSKSKKPVGFKEENLVNCCQTTYGVCPWMDIRRMYIRRMSIKDIRRMSVLNRITSCSFCSCFAMQACSNLLSPCTSFSSNLKYLEDHLPCHPYSRLKSIVRFWQASRFIHIALPFGQIVSLRGPLFLFTVLGLESVYF